MASTLDMSLDSMIENLGGMRVRGGGRGMGLRGVRGPFGGARRSHCRGPLGLRAEKGPQGTFGGARRSHGHPRRGPLGLKGVRGPGCTFRGVRKLDGHHFQGSLGLRGVSGPEGTTKGASGLDGHPCRGPMGLRAVRGPGGTFRGAGRVEGPPHRGHRGMYAIIKSMHETRNLPGQDSVLEDRFKAVGSSGEESGTKLLVSNLNAGVLNEDIRALFSEIGELIRYGVHYDKDGNPCGSAEIVFAQRSDAFQAVKRYNNADLNGKPMKIEKVGSIMRDHVASRLNMTGRAHGRRTDRMRPGPGYMRDVAAHNNGAGSSSQRGHGRLSDGVPIHGRGCGGGRRGRHGVLGGRPVENSAEELDTELENYQAGTNEAGTSQAGTNQAGTSQT